MYDSRSGGVWCLLYAGHGGHYSGCKEHEIWRLSEVIGGQVVSQLGEKITEKG